MKSLSLISVKGSSILKFVKDDDGFIWSFETCPD